MFRTYRFIESPIQTLQKHVEEIVNVWCDADGDFDVALFKDADLRELAENIEINNKKGKHDRRWKHDIEDIFKLFKSLDSTQREEIRNHFDINNQIEKLCKGELKPAKYSDLPLILQEPLKRFFNDLYNKILNRKPFIDKYETAKSYFDKLINTSRLKICPFCGLDSLKSKFDDGRDAFDHYIPKGTYPFNSVNFFNLAPICHTCNSDYKSDKDPLFHNNSRIQLIFPFGGLPVSELSIQVIMINQLVIISTIKLHDFEVKLTKEDATKNWDRIFSIKKRYSSKICQELRDWIHDLHNDYRKMKGAKVEDFIEDTLYRLYDRPLRDKNFLKYAIFTALNEDGTLAQSLEEAVTRR